MKQPWIGKPVVDLLFILFPPFGCMLFIMLFPGLFANNNAMPDAGWVILILLVDVAHVYSTLYRTYFDRTAFQQQKQLLVAIPFIGYVAGVLLYALGSMVFWRILAYVAIYHFVRQQYGFLRVYSRRQQQARWQRQLDTVTIYTATIYPLLYWHVSGPRNFNWFMENDLLYVDLAFALPVMTGLYWLVVVAWVVKEVALWWHTNTINVPKALVVTGTLLSWYVGIVYYNGDMAFTLFNVISHGIPYMALIWLYGRRNYVDKKQGGWFLKLLFSGRGLAMFVGLLFVFAFIEEGLWDVAVWQEHGNIFKTGAGFRVDETLLAFIVPLLALPQITHYILDGFIWRIRDDEFKWKR